MKTGETIKNAINEVGALKDEFNELKDEFRKKMKEKAEPSIKKVFDSFEGRLKEVSIIGYTPGFNDGDPCYHSQYLDYDYDYEEENDVTDKEWSEVESFFDSLDEFFENQYETDWRLVYKYKDGNLELDVESYDCGY